MHRQRLRTLISASQIQARVLELGKQIVSDYPPLSGDPPLLLIGILKGACFFVSDLARAIDREISLDFITLASYGYSAHSSGEVRVTKDLDLDIGGLDVLVAEDIVDTGLTAHHLLQMLKRRRPRSLRLAALLNKPTRRQKPVELAYVGFEIADHFVVGYGLDHAERYRNLPDLCMLEDKP